jgi:hypothetical protein
VVVGSCLSCRLVGISTQKLKSSRLESWAPAPIRQTWQLPYHFLAWYGNQYILPYHMFAFVLLFSLHIYWCKYNVEPELWRYFIPYSFVHTTVICRGNLTLTACTRTRDVSCDLTYSSALAAWRRGVRRHGRTHKRV